MNEDRMDRLIRDAGREYNVPPETPHEEMWARIEGARRMRGGWWRRRTGRGVWVRRGVGAAAVLAVGIGIGRLAAPPRGPAVGDLPQSVGTVSTSRPLPYRVAAVEHLSQAEALLTTYLLTTYRTDERVGQRMDVTDWARELLTTTRLLLDSPAASDHSLRMLLEDLELVLAQLAQISSDEAGGDEGFATQAIEERNVLLRLRTAVPAGPPSAGT